MPRSVLFQTDATIVSLVLFVLMMLFIFLGWQIGKWKAKNTEKKPESSGLTALLFFLLAFTFGMSGARFDDRRKIIVEEANHISTALLRSDMYPQEERSMFISDFKEYVEARIEYFMAGADVKRIIFPVRSLPSELFPAMSPCRAM